MSTHPCFKRFAQSCINGGVKRAGTAGGRRGRGRREEGYGRVLTELINELALRDKA